MPSPSYLLPTMLGDQYVLTSVLRESTDTVTYAATQKDMRRDVVVESLREEAMSDPLKVDRFLQTAKIQAGIDFPCVASALELLYAEGTWHLAKERIKGEALDMMAASGRSLTVRQALALLLHLCHACVYMDIEGIACEPFSLERAYVVENDFRFDNLSKAGERTRSDTQRHLSRAARLIRPLVEENEAGGRQVMDLLGRMRYGTSAGVLGAVWYGEEIVRMQVELAEAQGA